ncbi:hypothetical protein L596_021685 [Steinernema carpocapsae]|uniref:Uncharacterized protein n=1 Tax=Steinernema carpocapsae TaxID=34508 RepID=A0A4U5MJG6_STECR|nr:hypothetical protein L596_021685 [Steinernema carpocapsae]
MQRSLGLLPLLAAFSALFVFASHAAPSVRMLLSDKTETTTKGWGNAERWFYDNFGWKFSAQYEDIVKWQNFLAMGLTLAYIILVVVLAIVLCCCCLERKVKPKEK